MKSPTMGFICAGDRNDIDSDKFLQICPTFPQMVTKPTHRGGKVLDICVSDLSSYYNEPVIRDLIEPNIKNRVPSDHFPWYAQPHTDLNSPVIRATITKTVRPITEEVKKKFANWIQRESWEDVYNGENASSMALNFHTLVHSKIEEHCP